MHTSCFAFGYLESVCVCPMCYFIDALLQLTLCSSHILWSGSDTEVVNIKITINFRSKKPCNTVNFYIKQCHWQNTSLRVSLFLFVEIKKMLIWFELGIACPRENFLWSSAIFFTVQGYGDLSLFWTSKWSHKPSPDHDRRLTTPHITA